MSKMGGELRVNILFIFITFLLVSCRNEEYLHKEYFDSGELKMEGYKKNSKKNNLWKLFYKNNKPHGTGYFINDKLEGEWVFWYDNGNVFQKGCFFNGTKHGSWKTFDNETGKIILEKTYSKGISNGTITRYYNQGELYKKVSFVTTGKLTGKIILITKSGDSIFRNDGHIAEDIIEYNHFNNEFEITPRSR